jgi:ubiquinone/menaquinone biosynthesis C-methylase UbiE
VADARDTAFYDRNFRPSADELNRSIRASAFGEDIGQFSWTTADEHLRFQRQLGIGPDSHVLEVASGSGGPALFLARSTGCRLTGIDVHDGGIDASRAAAAEAGLDDRLEFLRHDAQQELPFADETFDAVLSIDSMNHLFERQAVFREWRRVLKPGGRFLFTDAVVVSGPLRRQEMIDRGPAMGEFIFTPAGWYERALAEAGFESIRVEDVTANIAGVGERWHAARAAVRADLLEHEGQAKFDEFQRFLAAVALLAREGRLRRYAYGGLRP